MPAHTWQRWLLTLLAITLVVLSWQRTLDTAATRATEATFNKTLAVYAVTRTLNGVISVAQGTEIAIQPVGVGVTLTAGEILDPLNDLIERFSWLVLMALASLGVQMLVTELFAHAGMNALVTIAAAGLIASVWLWLRWPVLGGVARWCAVLLFVRFAIALATLITGTVNESLLRDRQDAMVAELTMASDDIADLDDAGPLRPDATVLDRLGQFLDEQGAALNVSKRLDRLAARAEAAIGQVINLLVIYTVETVILPIAVMLLVYALIKQLWRWPGWRREPHPA